MTGRSVSERASSSTGLLFKSNPRGIVPPCSPANNALPRRRDRSNAASIVGTIKHRRPAATAVIAVVVARTTSIATAAYSRGYRETLSGKQSIRTLRCI
jgi:hypothetical protein